MQLSDKATHQGEPDTDLLDQDDNIVLTDEQKAESPESRNDMEIIDYFEGWTGGLSEYS